MVIKVLQTLAEYGHFNLLIAIIITKKMLVFEIKHSDLVVSKNINPAYERKIVSVFVSEQFCKLHA